VQEETTTADLSQNTPDAAVSIQDILSKLDSSIQTQVEIVE
jgi:hypothetical protein